MAAWNPAWQAQFASVQNINEVMYNAMTPDQKQQIQQNWQQWQSYQEQYAQWHAQYGAQYEKEMQKQKQTQQKPPSTAVPMPQTRGVQQVQMMMQAQQVPAVAPVSYPGFQQPMQYQNPVVYPQIHPPPQHQPAPQPPPPPPPPDNTAQPPPPPPEDPTLQAGGQHMQHSNFGGQGQFQPGKDWTKGPRNPYMQHNPHQQQQQQQQNPNQQKNQWNKGNQMNRGNQRQQMNQGNQRNQKGFQKNQGNPEFQPQQNIPGFQNNQNNPGFQRNQNNPGFQRNQNNPGFQRNQNNPGFQRNQMNQNQGNQKNQKNQNNPGFQKNQNNPGFQKNQNNPGFQKNQNNPGFQKNQMNPGFQKNQNQGNQFGQGRNQRNPRQNQQMNKFQEPGPMNQQFNQRQQNFGPNQQQWNQQQNWGQQNRQQGNNWNRNQGPPPLMSLSWGNRDNSFDREYQDDYQEEEAYEDYPEGGYSHYDDEYNEEEVGMQRQQELIQKPQKASVDRFYEDNFDEVPLTSSQVDDAGPSTKIPPPESMKTTTKEDAVPKETPEKDEDELRFDEQFKKWEEQYLNWKEQNQNHPDRRAYREYEMKFEECRKNLLERREQMRRRKMQERLQEIRAEESAQEEQCRAQEVEKVEEVPKVVEVQEKKSVQEESQAAASSESEDAPQKQLENLGNLFNVNSGSIPGLDLVTHEEKADVEAEENHAAANLLAGKLGEMSRGANLAEISRNISSLLKTPNLMDILSLVKGTTKEAGTVEHPPLEKPNLDPWIDMKDPWADIGAGRSQEGQGERYPEKNFDDRRIPGDFGHDRGGYLEKNFDDRRILGDFDQDRGYSDNFRDIPPDRSRYPERFPDRRFPEDLPDRRYPENFPERRFPEDFPDRRFPEDFPDRRFPEDLPDRRYPENFPERRFPEDFPDRRFPENFPDRRYPDNIQERRFLDNLPERRFPDDYPDRRLPEQVGMPDRGRMYDDFSALRRYPDRGVSRLDEDSMSQQSGNWMRNYGDRTNDLDNSRSSFSNVNYDDSGDIFRPTQVIDYQNMSRDRTSVDPLKDPLVKKWPEDDILRPAKVVDYGHKKADGAAPDIPVVKTFDYGHGSAVAKKKKPDLLKHHLSKKQMKRINVEAIIEAAKKKRKARIQNMTVIEQSKPDYPKKGWILIGEKPTFPAFPTKRGLRKTRSGRIQLPKAERRRQAAEANKLEYEGISDSEDDDDDVEVIGRLPPEVVQISDDDIDDLNESLPDVDDNLDNQMSDTSLPDAEDFDFPSADKFLSEKSAKRKADEVNRASAEKKRREEDIFPEINEEKRKTEDIFLEVEEKKLTEEDIFPEVEETGFHVKISDILDFPHRKLRPKRIIMIMRGPPGSGKTHFAKLIKDREVENGGSAPRILSIDDYYMTEEDEVVKCPETNKMIEMKKLVYTYEEGMEEQYTQYLLKSFRKTITDGFFDFIIVDCNNKELEPHQEIVNFGSSNGFTSYTCEMTLDLDVCFQRNTHGRSKEDIKAVLKDWPQLPEIALKISPKSLEILNREAQKKKQQKEDEGKEAPEEESAETQTEVTEETEKDETDATDETTEFGLLKSKWDSDRTEEQLARLDGTSKPLRHSTMEDFLQDADESMIFEKDTKPGQKRVRWADIEERRAQEKMRAIGFVVGQTDWSRMMDPTQGSSALTQTKYIERHPK